MNGFTGFNGAADSHPRKSKRKAKSPIAGSCFNGAAGLLPRKREDFADLIAMVD